MTSLSSDPNTNILNVPGFGASSRAQVTNMLNTFARSFGADISFGEGDTQEAINNKVNVLRSSMMAHGAGEKALGALQAYMSASPNRNMPPEASAELAAQLMVAQQRQIDQHAFAVAYGKDSGNVFGPNFLAAFDKAYPATRYQAESEAFKRLMLSNAGKSVFGVYNSGNANPDQLEEFLTKHGAPAGIGRYFGVGG
jgi:hypothetical protein